MTGPAREGWPEAGGQAPMAAGERITPMREVGQLRSIAREGAAA